MHDYGISRAMNYYEWNFIGGLTDDPDYPDGGSVRVVAESEEEARIMADAVLPVVGMLDGRTPFRMPAGDAVKGVTVKP